MKKLLGIVVLGLMLSSNTNAELITLKDCYQFKDQSTDGNDVYEFNSLKEQTAHKDIHYENLLFTLDTVTEVITQTQILKESYIEGMLKNNNYIMEKHQKLVFRITDLGGNVATAVYKGSYENKIDVDFVANKVYRIVKMKFSDGSGWTTRTVFQCKKQK